MLSQVLPEDEQLRRTTQAAVAAMAAAAAAEQQQQQQQMELKAGGGGGMSLQKRAPGSQLRNGSITVREIDYLKNFKVSLFFKNCYPECKIMLIAIFSHFT